MSLKSQANSCYGGGYRRDVGVLSTMPRARKAPRLYLKRRRAPRRDVWIIRDGAIEIRTGCGEHDHRGASEALARYIAAKYTPPGALPASELFIDEVIASYLKEHAQHSASREFLTHTATPVLTWWSGKKLSHVNKTNCRKYVEWRTSQTNRRSKRLKLISEQTARHDLKTLRTAINWYHGEYPLPSVPKVWLPAKAPQREDYWLSRDEAAARIKAARRNARTRHVARQILIGVYSGTRPGAILALKWLPSPTSGWFDMEAGVLYRRGINARRTKKRQPPARIHAKLLPHLIRWRAMDAALGITSVVHYQGMPVKKLRNSWKTVAQAAGASGDDGPHITRHTAATWLMQAGVDVFEASGYLGMSPETLWETYGHHHPEYQSAAANAVSKKLRRPLVPGSQSGSRRSSKIAK
jgi:integrase